MSKVITSLEAKKLISTAFVEQSINYWHICDNVVRLPTLKQVIELVEELEATKFIPEIADCDNLSLILASKFVAKGLAIAMIDVEQLMYGVNHPDYRHQLCATVLDTEPIKVLCIEPATGVMFEPNELLRLKFVDLRT